MHFPFLGWPKFVVSIILHITVLAEYNSELIITEVRGVLSELLAESNI